MTLRPRFVLIALLLALGAGIPAPAHASPLSAASAYLAAHQAGDGCLHEPGGALSSQGWGVLGLAAAGRPLRARSAAACLARQSAGWTRATDLALAGLAAVAAGRSATGFGGRNVIAALLHHRRANGSLDGLVNGTAFGVLALRAARHAIPWSTRIWLTRAQASDGSFSYLARQPGDADMTAAAIQGLHAAGLHCSGSVLRRAYTALARFRKPSGGYGSSRWSAANAQSTAWAIEARAACGLRTSGARAWLASLQRADGSIRYSRSQIVTPVWVTAQALLGLANRGLPIRP